MDAFVIPKTLTYLFLSINNPTTLHFDEPVEFIQAGRNGDFSLRRSNNKKVVVIQPLIEKFEPKALVVITASDTYNFRVLSNDKDTHTSLFIHSGKMNKSYIKKIETNLFKILEGDNSVLVINKSKSQIIVNEQPVARESLHSKGLPLIINSQIVNF